MNPVKVIGLNGKPLPITGIKLHMEGNTIVISVETAGKWVELFFRDIDYIREQSAEYKKKK